MHNDWKWPAEKLPYQHFPSIGCVFRGIKFPRVITVKPAVRVNTCVWRLRWLYFQKLSRNAYTGTMFKNWWNLFTKPYLKTVFKIKILVFGVNSSKHSLQAPPLHPEKFLWGVCVARWRHSYSTVWYNRFIFL